MSADIERAEDGSGTEFSSLPEASAPWSRLWAPVIACVPLLIMALVIFPRFDGLYGQDSFAYLGLAESLADPVTRLDALASRTSPGYPMAMLLAPGRDGRAGQWVSLAAAILLVLGCSMLLAEVEPEVSWSERLLTSLAISCCGVVWQLAISVMSDIWTMALVVWSLVLWVRSTRSPKWQPLLALGALLMGCAIIARPAALILIPIAGLVELLAWRDQGVGRRLSRAAVAVLVVLPLGVVWLLSPADVAMTQHGALADWRLDHVFGFGQAADQRGWGGVLRSSVLFYVFGPAHPEVLGVLALLAPIGLIRVARSGPALLTLVMVVVWPALVAFFLAGFSHRNPRFALMLLAPLAMLVGLGLRELAMRGETWRGWALAGVVLGVVVQLTSGAQRVSDFVSWKDDDLAAVRHAEAHTAPGDVIVAFGVTATADHYTEREVIELYTVDRARFQQVMAEPKRHHVLVDREDVAVRRRDEQVARDLAELEAAGWMPVHRTGRWTLLSHGVSRRALDGSRD